MIKPKHQRLVFILCSVGLFTIAALLAMNAFRDNIVFFYSPTELHSKKLLPGARFRIGGLVEKGSLTKQSSTYHFNTTDGHNHTRVEYTGLLPDLFREGQGVVAEGSLNADGLFIASRILAKHDENYMPRELVDSLKASGRWREGDKP